MHNIILNFIKRLINILLILYNKIFLILKNFYSKYQNEKLYITLCDKNAKLPIKKTSLSAGYDLYSVEDLIMKPGSTYKISTGIKIITSSSINKKRNLMIEIKSRSGLGLNGINVIGGVIDMDYTGIIHVILFNSNNYNYFIKKGDRIAQFVVLPIINNEIIEITNKKFSSLIQLDNQRLDNGFGSTGNN